MVEQLEDRIGLVGDVHAEDELLDATLGALRRAGVTRILCTGDIADGTGSDLLRSPDVQLVLNGHTHRPMVRHFAGVTIVNGGTIFRQHEPGYLILDFGSGAALWHSLVPGAPARTLGSLFG